MITNTKKTSRKRSVKILAIGAYAVLLLDVIQGIVFVPLYLNYIGEKLYGLWLGTGGLIGVLGFLDLGIATLTIQRVSREYGAKKMDGVSKYFFGGFLINTMFMLILAIFGFVLSFWIGGLFSGTTESDSEILTSAFRVALFALIISLFNNTIQGTLNALQKPLAGKIFEFAGALFGIVTIYLMLLGENSLMAIPVGMLVRSSVAFFPNLIYLISVFVKNKIKLFSYDKEIVKDYIKLTPNLFLSKFGTSLVANIEPTLINLFLTPQIAVYFTVTKKAGSVIRTILDRIGGILYPSIAHMFGEANKKYFSDTVLKINRMLFPLTLVLFLSYSILNESFVTIWVGSENYLGDVMTILISISLLTSFYSNIFGYLLSTTGEIKFTNNVVFLESISKIVLLLIGLAFFGVYGLPIAIIFSSLIFISIFSMKWNKYLEFPKNIRYVNSLKSIGILLFSSAVCYYVLQKMYITNIQEFILSAAIILSILTLETIILNKDYSVWVISKLKKTLYASRS